MKCEHNFFSYRPGSLSASRSCNDDFVENQNWKAFEVNKFSINVVDNKSKKIVWSANGSTETSEIDILKFFQPVAESPNRQFIVQSLKNRKSFARDLFLPSTIRKLRKDSLVVLPLALKILFSLKSIAYDLMTLPIRIATLPYRFSTVNSYKKHPFYSFRTSLVEPVNFNPSSTFTVMISYNRKTAFVNSKNVNVNLRLAYTLVLDDTNPAARKYGYCISQTRMEDRRSSTEGRFSSNISTTSISDHFKLLGLPNTAKLSEVKKKYRTLARKIHPDKNKGPKSTERMQKLNDAYLNLQLYLKKRAN